MNCFSITQVQSITAGTGNKCQQRRRTEPFADKHAGLQCHKTIHFDPLAQSGLQENDLENALELRAQATTAMPIQVFN